jgi:hypothetical protein
VNKYEFPKAAAKIIQQQRRPSIDPDLTYRKVRSPNL